MYDSSAGFDRILALWSPAPFPTSHQYEYELIRRIRHLMPFCCISCCRGYSDISLKLLKRADLILILLPDDSHIVENFLLHPMAHPDHYIYVICRRGSSKPSPAERSIRRLRIDPVSILTISLKDIAQNPQAVSGSLRLSEGTLALHPSAQPDQVPFDLVLQHALESAL